MEFVEDRDTLDKWCVNRMEPREMLGGIPQPGPFLRKDGSVAARR